MNEDLTRDYLQKSGFTAMQADALSQILAETATKDDLHDVERRLSHQIDEVRTELRELMAHTLADLVEAIADAQTQTMRWGIAMIIAMTSIFTLLDVFID